MRTHGVLERERSAELVRAERENISPRASPSLLPRFPTPRAKYYSGACYAGYATRVHHNNCLLYSPLSYQRKEQAAKNERETPWEGDRRNLSFFLPPTVFCTTICIMREAPRLKAVTTRVDKLLAGNRTTVNSLSWTPSSCP